MWIDLDAWPRRAAFDHYRAYDSPFFGLSAPIDVTPTRAWCRDAGRSFFLAAWWATLVAAAPIAPLRQRLRGVRVWQHPQLGVATTVLGPDDNFRFCRLTLADDFATFHDAGRRAIAAATAAPPALVEGDDDVLYGTVVPWVAFTGIRHARRGDPQDSVPRVAFGKIIADGAHQRLPVAVDAHHALVDGLHVGRLFEALTARFADPDTTFGPR
jgi:chloramphenicol O-acetyltransferase type A